MTIIGNRNKYTSERVRILSELNVSQSIFRLTGSCRFGFNTQDSDVDLFAEFFIGTVELLKKLGFYKIDPDIEFYADSNCVMVMRHKSGIDIQLRRDVELYEKTCKFIEDTPYLLYIMYVLLDKPKRKKFWNVMLRFICDQ